MRGRPTKTDQEIGYVRDWWSEARTLEADFQGTVLMYVSPTPRPGVWAFRIVFVPLMGDMSNHMGTLAIEAVYPNVEQSTMAGFLWRKTIALSRMVREAAEQRNGQRIIGG